MKNAARQLALLCLLFVAGCSSRPTPLLQEVAVLEMPFGVQSLAWHPDGRRIAVGYFARDEVEIWDVESRRPVFKVPSKRRPVNQAGQEVLFSPDGNYLVVQDTVDTQPSGRPFPRRQDDALEAAAEVDRDRLVLATVWDLRTQKEIARITGPGSWMHGGPAGGMCWMGGDAHSLVLLRGSAVDRYEFPSGRFLDETSALFPFPDHPSLHRGYWRMSCHPSRPEVALEGARLTDEAPVFGFAANSGATPIVVADVQARRVEHVMFSATSLNGLTYSAAGDRLGSYGHSPVRVFDSRAGYAPAGTIEVPSGASDHFVAMPGGQALLGVADAFYRFDLATLKVTGSAPAPRGLLRLALHSATGVVAAAEGPRIHLYRLSDAGVTSH